MKQLLDEIRSCTFCQGLPCGYNPIVSFTKKFKILIIGQAPSVKGHNTFIPWDDLSGERLRDWMGISREDFYNPDVIALMPMGFCYPGRGKLGDMPPRPECAPRWHEKVLSKLKDVKLIILIGQYAQKYYLNISKSQTLTQTLKNYIDYTPKYFIPPHPSPRNNIWLAKNPWFEKNLVPELKKSIKMII